MKKQIDYPIESATLVDHPLIVSRINLDIRDKYDELQVQYKSYISIKIEY